MQTLAVIPARGGSRGLLRKNMLPIDGEPMFLRSAYAARDAGCVVVVSSDDVEVLSVAKSAGLDIHIRGSALAQVTVDRVVQAVANKHDWDGDVLLVQPTVQPVTAAILAAFIDTAKASGQTPVSLGEPDNHQLWDHNAQRWLTERVNRQDIQYPLTRELGIRWWHHRDEIGLDPVTVVPWVFGLVDIDTASDYRAAQPRKQVTIVPISDLEHGRGHLHRCLAIAQRLQHHDVTFSSEYLDDTSERILHDYGWNISVLPTVSDLIVDDSLGRVVSTGAPMLSLEDEGAGHGDRTINALYEDGADFAVIRPEFTVGTYTVSDTVDRVMLLFGGTDPAGLTKRVHNLLQQRPHLDVDVIQPGDHVPVAVHMRQADILFTSAGRTVFEAAALGVPTIVIAQNDREATHQHVGIEHGNIYLGQADEVSDSSILTAFDALAADPALRLFHSQTGRPDGKGLDRIMHIIEGMLAGI